MDFLIICSYSLSYTGLTIVHATYYYDVHTSVLYFFIFILWKLREKKKKGLLCGIAPAVVFQKKNKQNIFRLGRAGGKGGFFLQQRSRLQNI